METIELSVLNHCPVCGGAERKTLYPIPRSTVYQCRSCHLRYIDPCLSPDSMQSAYESDESLTKLHQFHDGYYDYGDLKVASKTLSDFKQALALLEKNLSGSDTSRTIFDVGYGNGLFLGLAKEQGWQVSGVDSSAKNRELARKRFSLELACGDFDHYDNRGVTFDAISFWDVIEHFPNPHAALKKARQMLKPDGLILIGIPNDRSLLGFISTVLCRLSFGLVKKGIEMVYILEHVAYYNLKTLNELLRRNGFSPCEHFYTSTDLEKYDLPGGEKFLARIILLLGKITALQNRLVGVWRKG